MSEDPKKLQKRAVEASERARTPEQQAHYEAVTRRNTAIQTGKVKAVDGVCFGKQTKGKA